MVPRDEQREITWSAHASKRLQERGVEPGEAEGLIRAGAWHPSASSTIEPKWSATGSLYGQRLEIVFVETVRVERVGHLTLLQNVLHVVTVIRDDPRRRR